MGMQLFGRKEVEYRDQQLGIGDPALAEYLGIGLGNASGVQLSELSSLGLSAVWRSVVLIAGTIATLPLNTYERTRALGGRTEGREQVESFLDAPHPDLTPFEWVELILAHELLWGNSYLLHMEGGAGQIAGLAPLPPWTVSVDRDRSSGMKVFKTRDINGDPRELTPFDLTHIPAFGTDGLKGLSPIAVARHSLGAALAGDRAAGRMFKNGLLLGGILRPTKEALTKTQKDQVLDGLRSQAGVENAGDVAFVPAPVEFSPWTMNAVDAQFLESRHFGIEECSRWLGVPRELLSESGASSWGSGIAEIVRGFGRFCLATWTTRIQQRLSTTLPERQFCEFDYSAFLQPSPEEEIDLLIRQIAAGLLTVDEARTIRNMGPKPTQEQTETETETETNNA
jgi:HK97 family phage portal protein